MNDRTRRIGDIGILMASLRLEITLIDDYMRQNDWRGPDDEDSYLELLESKVRHYHNKLRELRTELRKLKSQELRCFAPKNNLETLVQDN